MSAKAVKCIFSRWSSGHHVHVATPPVFDSKVGFTDYEKERREFHLEVPEYFNFANVLDEWAQKEKVGTYVLYEMRTYINKCDIAINYCLQHPNNRSYYSMQYNTIQYCTH